MTEHGWQRLMRLSVIGIGYLASLTPSASQEHMGLMTGQMADNLCEWPSTFAIRHRRDYLRS